VSDAGFDSWLRALQLEGGDDESLVGDAADEWAPLRRWFQRFYLQHGAMDPDRVRAAFLEDQLALARSNAALVIGDIFRTTGRTPDVVVDEFDGTVRITFDGSYTTPSIEEWENPVAPADVAGYLQEQMFDDGIWPRCPRDDGMVLPEVRGDTAMWWCRTYRHPVSPIGDLGGTA
jgi:hypothetical protein